MFDTGADVTIVGGDVFKQVAAVAKLHKKDFKLADKTPHNYDCQPFRLDGRLDLDVIFSDCTMPISMAMTSLCCASHFRLQAQMVSTPGGG